MRLTERLKLLLFFFFVSVRQESNRPPPPGTPPSHLGHLPRGSRPSAPTPPQNPLLSEGRSMECSPMTGEGRGQHRNWHTEASKLHHHLSQNICASFGSVDHYHQAQVAGLSLAVKLLLDMGILYEHERSHW